MTQSNKKPLTDEERQAFIDNLPSEQISPNAQETFEETIERAAQPQQSKPETPDYASAYGLDGSVRQYNSLIGVENWIKRGVPLVASIAWNNTDANPDNDLTGAAIPSSGGHPLVITGFTAQGEVITNDPAGATNQDVRRVYNRAQFERIWQNASAGTVYVIKSPLIKG